MKPENFLKLPVDHAIMAKPLGVTKRQVQKARRHGVYNDAMAAIEALEPAKRGNLANDLLFAQDNHDAKIEAYRAARVSHANAGTKASDYKYPLCPRTAQAVEIQKALLNKNKEKK